MRRGSGPLPTATVETVPIIDERIASNTGIVRGLTVFLLVLLVVDFLARFVVMRRLTRWMVAHGVDTSIVSMAHLAGQIASAVLALSIGMAVAGFGSIVTALSAVSGAIVIAVGLAANDIIGNLLAGLYIINEDLFEVGETTVTTWALGRTPSVRLRAGRASLRNIGLLQLRGGFTGRAGHILPWIR